MLLQRTLLGVYRILEFAGITRWRLLRPLFRTAYFIYKRLEDRSLLFLVIHHPELFRNGHVLDVGANIGFSSILMSKVMISDFRVFAFEPEPFTYRELVITLHNHGRADRVTPEMVAVGDRSCDVLLRVSRSNPADHRLIPATHDDSFSDAIDVKMISIDEYVSNLSPSRIAFIKIDVQGSELFACHGMRQTIAANPEIAVLFEYAPSLLHEQGCNPEELLDFFLQRDFTLYCNKRNKEIVPVNKEDILRSFSGDQYGDLIALRRHSPAMRRES